MLSPGFKTMRPLVVLLAITCLLHPAWLGAATNREDSLLRRLEVMPADTHRVLTLNELFKATFTSEPLSALAYGKEGLQLARTIGYTRGEARLCNNLGVLHSRMGDYPASLRYYAQARIALGQLSDSTGRADCEMNIGSVYYKMGSYRRALAQYESALLQYRHLRDTTGALSAVNNIGSVYMEQGHYPEALKAYMAALMVRERLGDPLELAQSYANVGAIYQLEGSLEAAKRFFLRALQLATKAEDEFGRVAALTSLGEIAMAQEQFPTAKELFLQAEQGAVAIEDQYGRATALVNLGQLHARNQRPDSAASAYETALAIYHDMGRLQGEANTLSLLGKLHLAQGRIDAAEGQLLASLALSDSLQALDLSRENHHALADLYARRGRFEAAYTHQSRYLALDDSLHSREKGQQIADMQARYEASQQQQEINRLSLQATRDQLRIAQSAVRNAILLAIALAVGIVALILFLRMVQKQRYNRRIEEKNAEIQQQRDLLEAQNQRIKEINASLERMVEQRTLGMHTANAELDTFLYESAHALRRPLLRIQGLQDIIEAEQTIEGRNRLRGQIRITLASMDELLHKLILVSESGHRGLRMESVALLPLVTEIVAQQPLAEAFGSNLKADDKLVTDPFLLQGLLSAVLENAFRFMDLGKSGSEVFLQFERDAHESRITVRDTGTGIDAEHLPKVFDMFFRGPNQRGGNGLGLYIAKRICAQLQGSIDMQSQLGKGSTVTIRLPITPITPITPAAPKA